jgi:ankyrin repeat protein
MELLDAICYGTSEKVRQLVEEGADVNELVDGTSPLHYAATTGNTALIQLLLDNGADINATNCFMNTPLHNCSVFQHKAAAKLLISNGADINAINERGRTALDCFSPAAREELLAHAGVLH